MTFSRLKPSEDYLKLLELYSTLHEIGDPAKGVKPEDMFDGRSLPQHAEMIRNFIQQSGSSSLLDYGCGKAGAYHANNIVLPNGAQIPGMKEYWNIGDIGLYDPAVNSYKLLPHKTFDAVIATDVLEHCPETDLEWIISEIFSLSKIFVFCTIALYPAQKKLPDGRNAHITLKTAGWWVDLFEKISKKHNRQYILGAMYDSEKMTIIQN